MPYGGAKLLSGYKALGLDQFTSGHIPEVTVEGGGLAGRHDPKPPDLVALATQVLAVLMNEGGLATLDLVGLAVGRDEGPFGVLLLDRDGVDARPVCSRDGDVREVNGDCDRGLRAAR